MVDEEAEEVAVVGVGIGSSSVIGKAMDGEFPGVWVKGTTAGAYALVPNALVPNALRPCNDLPMGDSVLKPAELREAELPLFIPILNRLLVFDENPPSLSSSSSSSSSL